jgi:hypothetical protein
LFCREECRKTAAHPVDQVFPPLPVLQSVLSVPKRLCYFLQRDPEALGAVLHILLRVTEARLRIRSGCARGRLGAVSFVQPTGSTVSVARQVLLRRRHRPARGHAASRLQVRLR